MSTGFSNLKKAATGRDLACAICSWRFMTCGFLEYVAHFIFTVSSVLDDGSAKCLLASDRALDVMPCLLLVVDGIDVLCYLHPGCRGSWLE